VRVEWVTATVLWTLRPVEDGTHRVDEMEPVTPRGDVLLAARGVSRRFGPHVGLAPTDLDLHSGEVLALIGPNGAGKSTMLALLAGAIEPSTGAVERRDGVRVGWAPQRPGHYARLSALENLLLFARLVEEADPDAAAERLASRYELPDSHRLSGDLSVGMRQRLNLAIAQLGSPDVLLLDEPTASLDPEHRRRLWETVDAQTAAAGGVVFATQNLEEVERATRVARLRDGELVS
jgi:ABC-2 type transport system ATP-binding protein